jgi:hypothetical protein
MIKNKLRNEAHEILVGEWERISETLQNNDLDTIEKYQRIFEHLGMSKEDIEDMDTSEFFELIKDFRDTDMANLNELTPSIECEGYTYEAKKDLKIKDTKLIEKFIKSGNPFTALCMAVIFRRTDLSDIEHYDMKHIEHKAKIFRKHMTVSVSMPYIVKLSKELAESLEVQKNAVTE